MNKMTNIESKKQNLEGRIFGLLRRANSIISENQNLAFDLMNQAANVYKEIGYNKKVESKLNETQEKYFKQYNLAVI